LAPIVPKTLNEAVESDYFMTTTAAMQTYFGIQPLAKNKIKNILEMKRKGKLTGTFIFQNM